MTDQLNPRPAHVIGVCPACHRRDLICLNNGHIQCIWADCPDWAAVDKLLNPEND